MEIFIHLWTIKNYKNQQQYTWNEKKSQEHKQKLSKTLENSHSPFTQKFITTHENLHEKLNMIQVKI